MNIRTINSNTLNLHGGIREDPQTGHTDQRRYEVVRCSCVRVMQFLLLPCTDNYSAAKRLSIGSVVCWDNSADIPIC